MDKMFVIFLIIGLTLILVYVALSILYPSEKRVKKSKKEPHKESAEKTVAKGGVPLFDSLSKIIKNSSSSKETLYKAVEDLVRFHGKIHQKLGDLAHPDFKRYAAVVMALSKHNNTDKDLIMKLDRGLRSKNPKYSEELDAALNKGLALRNFK